MLATSVYLIGMASCYLVAKFKYMRKKKNNSTNLKK